MGAPFGAPAYLMLGAGLIVTGALGVFYRSCLWSLLGVSRDLHTEILFVLSARVPLRVLVQKLLL